MFTLCKQEVIVESQTVAYFPEIAVLGEQTIY